MFLGYQNEIISMIGSTREELENIENCKFDRIEETDKEYFLYNGQYVYEISKEQQIENMSNARAEAYRTEVDPMMSEYNRKKLFNLFEDGEEAQLLSDIQIAVDNIKVRFPYPVDEVVEENLTEVSEDVIVESGESDEISG